MLIECAFHMAAPRKTSIVASDEKIAQTLQEEFDSEAAMEAANAAIPAVDQLQAEVWARAFCNLSIGSSTLTEQRGESLAALSAKKDSCASFRGGMFAKVDEGNRSQRDRASAVSISTRHSPRKSSPTVEGDHQLALALSEDHPQVDRELARRLHDLGSTPHVPKINGVIPPVEAANEDHQRLLDRLSLYGLTERRIAGDGNCQFRALSDQLYRSPEHHKSVRDNIVSQLSRSTCSYSGYVPMSYDEYLRKIAKDGEWGDHVTLQAAADYYGVKISLITSFKDTYFVEIMPAARKSARVGDGTLLETANAILKHEIYLSFWAEVHYNSLYPLGELPGALEN